VAQTKLSPLSRHLTPLKVVKLGVLMSLMVIINDMMFKGGFYRGITVGDPLLHSTARVLVAILIVSINSWLLLEMWNIVLGKKG
jgi:hypothetical protein